MSIHWGGRGAGHVSRWSLATTGAPALALNFLSGALDPRITFTRGSNATLVDATGKITYAPNNLVLYSTDTTNAAWGTVNTTVVGGVSDPVGGNNAQTVTATSAGGQLYQFVTIASAASTRYINSFWVRRRTGSGNILLFAPDGTSGTIAVTSAWTQFFTSGNGGPGFAYPGILITTSGDQVDVYFPTCSAVTYETALRPADQVATTASAYYGPRFDYNPVTLDPRGLLIEEARTNIQTYSEQFDNAIYAKINSTISANATIAPDGTTSADALTDNATIGGHSISVSSTVPATTHTLSVYAKANSITSIMLYSFTASGGVGFNLSNGTTFAVTGAPLLASYSITPAGNGWYRCVVQFTGTGLATPQFGIYTVVAGSFAYSGTGQSVFLWGAQVEAGAFATSYIPTVASTVPRSADVAVMTSTNFSSWYNPTEGTFVVNGSTLTSVNTSVPAFLAVSDGTNPNYAAVFADDSAGRPQFAAFVSSVNQFDLKNLSFTITANVPFSAAAAYKVNDFAMSTNGSAVATDTLGTMPTVNQFGVGCRHGNSRFLNGHLRQIRYYNTRLPDTSLQTLTV